MRRAHLLLGAAAVALAGPLAWRTAPAVPAAPSDAERLIGTWRLVSFQVDGRVDPVRGEGATGQIYYDGTGQMAAQIMPDPALRRPFVASQPTAEEAQAAIRGYVAYFGTYRVDEGAGTITHVREGNINPGGLGETVRRYEFLPGDRLALRPVGSGATILWERAR